jgi:hypothetical protein
VCGEECPKKGVKRLKRGCAEKDV